MEPFSWGLLFGATGFALLAYSKVSALERRLDTLEQRLNVLRHETGVQTAL